MINREQKDSAVIETPSDSNTHITVFCKKPVLVSFPSAKASQVKSASIAHGTIFVNGKQQQIVCARDFIMSHLGTSATDAVNRFKRVSTIAPHSTIRVNGRLLKVKFIISSEVSGYTKLKQYMSFVTGEEIHRYFHRVFANKRIKGFDLDNVLTLAKALLKPAPLATSLFTDPSTNPIDYLLPELNDLNNLEPIKLTTSFVRIKKHQRKKYKNISIGTGKSFSAARSMPMFTSTDSDSDMDVDNAPQPQSPELSASQEQKASAAMPGVFAACPFELSSMIALHAAFNAAQQRIAAGAAAPVVQTLPAVPATANPANTTLPVGLMGHNPALFLSLPLLQTPIFRAPHRPKPIRPASASLSAAPAGYSPGLFSPPPLVSATHESKSKVNSDVSRSAFTSLPSSHPTTSSLAAAFTLTSKRPAADTIESIDGASTVKKRREA